MRFFIRRAIIVCMCVTTIWGYGDDSTSTAAVVMMPPIGIDNPAAAAIAERMRLELSAIGVLKIVDQTRMDTILRKQGFLKNTDDSLAIVEAGLLLGAEMMIALSVVKIDNLITLGARVYATASGRVDFVVSEDCTPCDIKNAASMVSVVVAKKIAAYVAAQMRPQALKNARADLYIAASLNGADIEIDGIPATGKTPLIEQGLLAGYRRIAVRKGSARGVRTVMIEPATLTKVDIPLKHGTGMVNVYSEPPEAAVMVNGVSAGTAPVSIDSLWHGEHEIVIREDGFLPAKSLAFVDSGSVVSVNARLARAAYCTIVNILPGMRVTVNTIPLKNFEYTEERGYCVPAGEITVRAESVDYEVLATTVTLAPAEVCTVTFNPVSRFGTVRITSEPSGAQVLLNGRESGRTPFVNGRLLPGTYAVMLKAPGHNIREEDVIVSKDTATFHWTQIPTKAFMDSIKNVMHKNYYQQRIMRRAGCAVLSAGFFCAGLYFNNRTAEFVERMQSLNNDYALSAGTRTEYERYRTDFSLAKVSADKYARYRNINYLLAGIGAAGLGVSIFF